MTSPSSESPTPEEINRNLRADLLRMLWAGLLGGAMAFGQLIGEGARSFEPTIDGMRRSPRPYVRALGRELKRAFADDPILRDSLNAFRKRGMTPKQVDAVLDRWLRRGLPLVQERSATRLADMLERQLSATPDSICAVLNSRDKAAVKMARERMVEFSDSMTLAQLASLQVSAMRFAVRGASEPEPLDSAAKAAVESTLVRRLSAEDRAQLGGRNGSGRVTCAASARVWAVVKTLDSTEAAIAARVLFGGP